MKIFLTGQCSLHWGRMEYGNIGNYYIFEPLLAYLNDTFKNCEIITTFQCSKSLCNKFNLKCISLDSYYSFDNKNDNLKNAIIEYASSNYNIIQNKFMEHVHFADVVIQFDGDIWGDNADFIGKDRFMVGLLKSMTMQNLNKNVYMIAGSPGPFDKYSNMLHIIKKVYGNFKMVTNREPISTEKLEILNFPLTNTMTLPCPSFLFKSNTPIKQTELILENEKLLDKSKNDKINLIGFVLCGWNMPCGPYSKEKREDDEFEEFVTFVKFLLDNYRNTHIVFISHNNAFEKEPFKLKKGRDFKIISQLYSILKSSNYENINRITLLNGVYTAHETKSIINQMDFMISGRLHGCVAALTSHIPTLMISYNNGPPSHKLEGFSKFVDLENCISKPLFKDMEHTWKFLFENSEDIRKKLKKHIPIVKKQALKNFEIFSQN